MLVRPAGDTRAVACANSKVSFKVSTELQCTTGRRMGCARRRKFVVAGGAAQTILWKVRKL